MPEIIDHRYYLLSPKGERIAVTKELIVNALASDAVEWANDYAFPNLYKPK